MINPEQKAVGHTQDWSNTEQALEEIEQASAAAEELARDSTWFDRLVKRAPASEPAADQPPPSARRGRGRRPGAQS
jgi:hypothetical protein